MNKRNSAQSSRQNLKKALVVWLMQHAQACVFSLGQLCQHPVNSLLATAVVGIALALPGGFYLLLENSQHVARSWDKSAEISLFLKLEVEEVRALTLREELRELDGVLTVKYISPQNALSEFQQHAGLDEALAALESNPLPALLLLEPDIHALSATQSEKLLQRLRALPEVDLAQFDRQWIQRLFAIINILRQAVIILTIILSLAVLLIVGNTIRLAIYNRRNEIEVNKLFGATDAFIQRPFLYAGLFHGLGGSLLAWALLSLSLFLLDRPVTELAELYSSEFRLIGLSAGDLLVLFAGGAGLGLSGSWFAVKRHIKAIEPA